MTTKYIDYLTEDKPIPRQNWVCMSFLSPEGIRNCTIRGLKIRGIFDTKEEADKHAQTLQSEDPDFHVFVGENGKWLAWDPDPNSVEDQRYKEKELNDLMKGYRDNLDKSKKMQEQRKQDMLKDAAKNEKNKSKESGKTKDRLKKELERRKKTEEPTISDPPPEPEKPKLLTDEELELKQKEESIKDIESVVKVEREFIETKQKNIDNNENEVLNLEKELEKMKSLYSKLNN